MGGELNCMILRDLELFVFTTQRLTRVHVFPFMTNEVIRARMDNHCELEGDKVLHERKLTSIDWQYIFSHRFFTFS